MNHTPKILARLLAAFTFLPLAACSSGVVPMGRDTYMISGSSPGLIGAGSVKAKLLRQADSWCRQRGLVMVPLNNSGSDAVVGGQWANAELSFRAVRPGDVEDKRNRMERAPDHYQVLEIRNR